jgi:hypothetical protein
MDFRAAATRPAWGLLLQAWIFIAGGLFVLAITVRDLVRRRDPDSVLLVLWILGTFVFAAYVNWTNNARSNLPIAPAVGILLVRGLVDQGRSTAVRRRWTWSIAAASAALALLVALGDARWANGVRNAAREVISLRRQQTLYFVGHWGLQYYLEQAGGIPIDRRNQAVGAGDLVVIPQNNTSIPRIAGSDLLAPTQRIQTSRFWVQTCGKDTGAGFYASALGPLPYVFGAVRPEPTDIYTVRKGFRFRPRRK